MLVTVVALLEKENLSVLQNGSRSRMDKAKVRKGRGHPAARLARSPQPKGQERSGQRSCDPCMDKGPCMGKGQHVACVRVKISDNVTGPVKARPHQRVPKRNKGKENQGSRVNCLGSSS